MIRGLYAATSGLLAAQDAMDIVANNLANTNTAGFKKDRPVNESFANMLMQRLEGGARTPLGTLGTGLRCSDSYTDLSQGAFRYTGSNLHFAIDGGGYFVLETPQGLRFTREGAFKADGEGLLVNAQGYRVLDNDGAPINAAEAHGELLMVVDFPQSQELIKVGYNMWEAPATAGEPLAGGTVKQEYLEASNVNAISEMTHMIRVVRQFEMGQKAVQIQDDTLGKAVNDIARMG